LYSVLNFFEADQSNNEPNPQKVGLENRRQFDIRDTDRGGHFANAIIQKATRKMELAPKVNRTSIS